jgi:L-fuconolactonase
MRVDAHHHVWTLSRGDYAWLTPSLGAIYRDFGPTDLAPLIAAAGIDATVLVQAAATNDETRYLLDVADVTPFVKGVVGWIDFEDPRQIDVLDAFASRPKFRGVRPLIQDIADVDWMLRQDLDWAFRAIIERDLSFDLLGHPRHLANALTLIRRYPSLRVVIDHALKPDIAHDRFADWADGMTALARETSAFCKLSGLITEAGADWTRDRVRPYAAHILDVFGPRRVMWGSDWPVVNLARDYEDWHADAKAMVTGIAGTEAIEAVFGQTAARFYRLS